MSTPKAYAEALAELAIVSGKISQINESEEITKVDPFGLKKAAEMGDLLKQRAAIQDRIAKYLVELMADPRFDRLHKPDD